VLEQTERLSKGIDMNIMTSLKKIINKLGAWPLKRGRNDHEGQNAGVTGWDCDRVPYPSIFDGIGPVTARMIIHRRIDKYIYAVYGLEGLKNNGRFHIERVSEADGNIVRTLLVDKQTGKTRTLYCKSVAKDSL
jgi:hypothetical protein